MYPATAWKSVGRKTRFLPANMIARLAVDAAVDGDTHGFAGDEVAIITAIILAEHGGDSFCCTIVWKDDPAAKAHCSQDVSLLALNTYWCGFDTADIKRVLADPLEAMREGRRVWKNNGFAGDAWNVYESATAGAWLAHKQTGIDAARAVGAL